MNKKTSRSIGDIKTYLYGLSKKPQVVQWQLKQLWFSQTHKSYSFCLLEETTEMFKKPHRNRKPSTSFHTVIPSKLLLVGSYPLARWQYEKSGYLSMNSDLILRHVFTRLTWFYHDNLHYCTVFSAKRCRCLQVLDDPRVKDVPETFLAIETILHVAHIQIT